MKKKCNTEKQKQNGSVKTRESFINYLMDTYQAVLEKLSNT